MSAPLDYELWCLQQESGELELASIRAEVGAISQPPLISALLVAGELDELWVAEGIDALGGQSYPRWELCAVQCGERSAIDDAIAARLPDHLNVRTCSDPIAAGAESALARALSLATGDYVLVLGEGDELAGDALLRLAAAIHSTGADLIYSDEDRIDARGRRSDPVFKPGFAPDHLLCTPYLGRLCAIRSQLVKEVGGIRPALGPAAEHDLLLRVSERAERVAHLPRILYHRRVLADADGRAVRGAPALPPAEASVAVAEAALERRGEDAVARPHDEPGMTRVIRKPPAHSPVSLIIRSDGPLEDLPLLRQLERHSQVPIDEVIVTGRHPAGDSPILVEDSSPARALNRAAGQATGDVLIFCCGCASLPSESGARWVGELVAQAARPEVGAVSGTVLDAEGRLRHGGLRVDLEGLGGPLPRGPDPELLGTAIPSNPGGASSDLLAIRRETFERADGFDAERLPGSLFGLALAFRLEEAGLTSVYTPVAQIQCRDSRPFPTPEEIDYMWSRWGSRIDRLLAYERSPLDPHRSPLAPERPALISFAAGRSLVTA